MEDTPIELSYPSRGSPELNPIEEGWRQLNQELGNAPFETLDEVRDAAPATLDIIKLPYLFRYIYLDIGERPVDQSCGFVFSSDILDCLEKICPTCWRLLLKVECGVQSSQTPVPANSSPRTYTAYHCPDSPARIQRILVRPEHPTSVRRFRPIVITQPLYRPAIS